MWEEVHLYLKFEFPQRRGVLHDTKNDFLLQFGVEMMSNFGASKGNNGGGEMKKKSNVEEGGKAFLKSAEEGEREFGFYL